MFNITHLPLTYINNQYCNFFIDISNYALKTNIFSSSEIYEFRKINGSRQIYKVKVSMHATSIQKAVRKFSVLTCIKSEWNCQYKIHYWQVYLSPLFII